MAITFPLSATNGQLFNVGNRSWVYSTAKAAWQGGQVVAAANAQTSEANALTYANNASNSASEAAASAVTALNVIAAQFKGSAAGGSVPNTSTAAGDYYWIISGGTSQNKTWAIGDRAIYNGTSGSWTQQTGVYPAQSNGFGLAGIKVISGSNNGLSIPDNLSFAYETYDLGFTLRFALPDFTPSSNVVLIDKVASNLGIRITLLTTGIIRVQFGNGTNLTTLQYDSSVALSTIAVDNQMVWLDIDIVRAGSIRFTVNGVQLGNLISISASVAQSLTNSGPLKVFNDGTNFFTGTLYSFYPRNVSLTTAELLLLYTTGPSALQQYSTGAQNINILTGALAINSNMTSLTGVTTTGFVAFKDASGQGNCSITIDNARFSTVNSGSKFRLRFTASIDTGTPTIVLQDYSSSTITGTSAGSLISGSNVMLVSVTTVTNALWRVFFRLNSTGTITVSNAYFDILGFLGIYEANTVAAQTVLDKGLMGNNMINNNLSNVGTTNILFPNISTYEALMASWPSATNLINGNTSTTTTNSTTAVATRADYWQINTGATLGSTGRIRLNGFHSISNRLVESGSMLDYTGLISAGFNYSSTPVAGDNGDIRIAFRASGEVIGPLQARGIGFRMNGFAVYGIYHNGTGSEVSVLLNANIGSARRNMLSFVSQKGQIQFFHQGICKAVVYDGPTGGSDTTHFLCFEGSNGTVASGRAFTLTSANGFSIFP